MNAILKYPGGKWRIADWIIAHFPTHRVYVEPFFGSGAVFFAKSPDYIETINDLDGDIVNLFRVCRDCPAELARLVNMTPFSREEYINCYEHSDDSIEQARRTLVRYHQSFGTSNSSKKSWRNVQTAGGPRCATMWNCLPKIIVDCCERLKEAQIENVNAIELIRRYDDPQTLVYCDPPYLLDTRKKGLYQKEMTDVDHEELLSVLKTSKSKIVLSAYDNEMYNSALKDWVTDEKRTQVQMGLKRTEKLYMNFDPPMLCFMGNGDNA